MLFSLLMWVRKSLTELPVSTSRIFSFQGMGYIGKEGRREGIRLMESITLASSRLEKNIFVVRP